MAGTVLLTFYLWQKPTGVMAFAFRDLCRKQNEWELGEGQSINLSYLFARQSSFHVSVNHQNKRREPVENAKQHTKKALHGWASLGLYFLNISSILRKRKD